HLVVQGGTFLNDCVLRAFECELGTTAVRPAIAGLMGAYGAALYAREQGGESSGLLSREALASFTHTSSSAVCHGCTNACRLTVNRFDGGRRYISGNRCEKGAGAASSAETLPTLYEWKLNALYSLSGTPGKRGKIGFPMALGMYELAPLWHAVFTALGFEVVLSERSSRSVYELGQFSIPSDTACYPAKLMHGHIESLIREGVPVIFYPCLSYNINEGDSANHYNCPVVAYYSELLRGNMDSLSRCDFFYPYLCIDSERTLADTLLRSFREHGWELTKAEARRAAKAGFAAYRAHIAAVRAEGERILSLGREQGRRIMILAGRPYHVDPEIHHGIDRLAASLGFAVVSEDAVSHLAKTPTLHVLNQWTYHARLYRAAIYASEHPDTELVQLVSFGCGVDAITTDEVCELLESRGKFYTQIKIDEITNLGAVKIRLRSLLGAIEKREQEAQRKGADPSHV
ncbi:MAG: 2-hydroxyacyl-CoA dehydratase, partial [Clostridia bacterium]|nr:2-hydroxyacyl-CoA dehydratase [Clostridia bacterium]